MKKSISIILGVFFFILNSIVVYRLIHYTAFLTGLRLYYVCTSSLCIAGILYVSALFLYCKKTTAQEPQEYSVIFARLLYIISFSILVSSFVIILNLGDEYHGAVIDKEGYLYNEIGIKILNVKGEVKYYDDVIYLMTRDEVYAIDYTGEVLSSKDFILEGEYGYGVVLQNPYRKEFYLRGDKLFSTAYSQISYLGKDDKYDFFACCQHGNIEILNVNKRTGVIDVLCWGQTFENVRSFGNPIRCFVVKQGRSGKILNTDGIECAVEEYGIFYPYWDENKQRLHYEDYSERRWYHQFE